MQSERFDLHEAWAGLAEMVGWIVSLFGAPAAIAQRFSVLRKERSEILVWLAPLEALARRLLFIEAAALPAPNAPPVFVASGKIASALRDAPHAELPEDSLRWRVVFRVGPGPPASSRQEKAGWKPEVRDSVNNAAPLARRLEALLRLTENRAAIVARLAGKLHAQPARTARAFAAYRHRAKICAEALAQAQAQADLALAAFADTS